MLMVSGCCFWAAGRVVDQGAGCAAVDTCSRLGGWALQPSSSVYTTPLHKVTAFRHLTIPPPHSHFRPPPLLQFELQGPDAPERLPASVAAALPALQESYDAGSEDVVQVRSRFDYAFGARLFSQMSACLVQVLCGAAVACMAAASASLQRSLPCRAEFLSRATCHAPLLRSPA